MRGDPGTRAALGRIGAVGGLEDRPLRPAQGLCGAGGCAGARHVCLHVCLHVCVAGGVDLQGSVSLSAGGHSGGSAFPGAWGEGKVARAASIAAKCQRLQEKARRFCCASLNREVLLMRGAGIPAGLAAPVQGVAEGAAAEGC